MDESGEHPLARRIRTFGTHLRIFTETNERRLLIISAATFVVVFTLLGAWKLWSFGYNGLDLAIYRQVAESSVRGDFFSFSIHPHSYLGDHLELFFLALLPFFAIIQHPLTLVVLQAAALAIAVFPLSRAAEHFIGKPWNLLIGLFYLANPVIQNMALFEFHMLPFAIPLVSFALLAYVRKRMMPFLFFSTVAMTVREDVSLVVVGLGVLALLERRSWQWTLIPITVGAVWFVGALKLTTYLSGYGQYKFLAYYQWLGASPLDAAKTALLRPWYVIQHLLAPSNLAFLAGLLLPFAYLPVLRPRWLLPVAPIVIQLLLVQSPGEILLNIHYPSLLIPFLVLASASAFRNVLHPPERGLFRKLANERVMTTIIMIVVALYGMLVIGPVAQAIPLVAKTPSISDRVRLERDVVRSLPDGATLAGFETVTELSDRPRLYSLHYVFLGKKQFSEDPYVVPDDVTVVLVDLRDFLLYQVLYKLEGGDNRHGYERVRNLLTDRGFSLTTYLDRFAVFVRGREEPQRSLFSIGVPSEVNGVPSSHGPLTFLGWSSPTRSLALSTRTVSDRPYLILPVSLTMQKNLGDETIFQLEFRFLKNDKLAYRTLMPLGGGMYPTSDWRLSEPVTSNYELLLPRFLAGLSLRVEARVLNLEGEAPLNAVRTIIPSYRRFEQVGPSISLSTVNVP